MDGPAFFPLFFPVFHFGRRALLRQGGEVTTSAPAKINLSLSVLGKRPDGFHAIESLMVPLTLADTITLEHRDEPGIGLTCSDPSLPTDDSNLVFRAARRFFETVDASPAIQIHLEKRIPHGAGLGGGSSDAASVLMALNALFYAPLSQAGVHELAAELGSDVPFFLARSAAFCRGRGEIVEPILFAETLPLLLIKPGFGVPTPWAYGRWGGSRELPGIDYGPQSFAWGTLVNDLERPVFEKYLFLAVLKRWLREQPEVAGALMSGSGSTTFAVLRDAAMGRELEARVRREFGGESGESGEIWTTLCATTTGSAPNTVNAAAGGHSST
jgi:4-diphosphocytidyl-2-C-methyl-D-erythritol kinase